MRNPNGYGGVCKLTGNRRKPYMARITVGWAIVDKETGEILNTFENMSDIEELPPNTKSRQLYEPIGYFKTGPEALIALAEYNKNPLSLDAITITFKKMYETWFAWKFNPKRKRKLSKQSEKSYQASFNASESLHDMKWLDIKTVHMQTVIWGSGNGIQSLNNLKALYNQLYDFALMNDIGTKNYAQFLEVEAEEKEEIHKPFVIEEISLLWKMADKIDGIDTALIMIYSGLRPSELLLLKTGNIDPENRTMQGGIKTAAGKDRIIPINKKILPLITKRKEEGNEYLICVNKQNITYTDYRKAWDSMMARLDLKHLPHDGRHTCATMLDNAGANKTAIKRIMGHSVKKDVTDSYTHKDIEELKKAIDLI